MASAEYGGFWVHHLCSLLGARIPLMRVLSGNATGRFLGLGLQYFFARGVGALNMTLGSVIEIYAARKLDAVIHPWISDLSALAEHLGFREAAQNLRAGHYFREEHNDNIWEHLSIKAITKACFSDVGMHLGGHVVGPAIRMMNPTSILEGLKKLHQNEEGYLVLASRPAEIMYEHQGEDRKIKLYVESTRPKERIHTYAKDKIQRELAAILNGSIIEAEDLSLRELQRNPHALPQLLEMHPEALRICANHRGEIESLAIHQPRNEVEQNWRVSHLEWCEIPLYVKVKEWKGAELDIQLKYPHTVPEEAARNHIERFFNGLNSRQVAQKSPLFGGKFEELRPVFFGELARLQRRESMWEIFLNTEGFIDEIRVFDRSGMLEAKWNKENTVSPILRKNIKIEFVDYLSEEQIHLLEDLQSDATKFFFSAETSTKKWREFRKALKKRNEKIKDVETAAQERKVNNQLIEKIDKILQGPSKEEIGLHIYELLKNELSSQDLRRVAQLPVDAVKGLYVMLLDCAEFRGEVNFLIRFLKNKRSWQLMKFANIPGFKTNQNSCAEVLLSLIYNLHRQNLRGYQRLFEDRSLEDFLGGHSVNDFVYTCNGLWWSLQLSALAGFERGEVEAFHNVNAQNLFSEAEAQRIHALVMPLFLNEIPSAINGWLISFINPDLEFVREINGEKHLILGEFKFVEASWRESSDKQLLQAMRYAIAMKYSQMEGSKIPRYHHVEFGISSYQGTLSSMPLARGIKRIFEVFEVPYVLRVLGKNGYEIDTNMQNVNGYRKMPVYEQKSEPHRIIPPIPDLILDGKTGVPIPRDTLAAFIEVPLQEVRPAKRLRVGEIPAEELFVENEVHEARREKVREWVRLEKPNDSEDSLPPITFPFPHRSNHNHHC